MQIFWQQIILALGPGAFDALLALGIVLIYRTTGVLNFAQAATGTIATFVIYSAAQNVPMWLALIVGATTGAFIGTVTYLTIRGIRSKHAALSSAVATLAVAVLLQQVVRIVWGIPQGPFPTTTSTQAWLIGQYSLPYLYLFAFATAVILTGLIAACLRWTRTGTMIRAMADNGVAAGLCGARVDLLSGMVWAISGVCAAFAGFFAAPISFTPFFLDPFFVAALIAAVLGGLRSLAATVIGAVLLEASRNLFIQYAGQLPIPVSSDIQTFLLLLLILILVLAPRHWIAQGPRRSV